MGNCCTSKKDKAPDAAEGSGSQLDGKESKKSVDDLKFDKSKFVMQKDEKFRDNYLIGSSMGTSTYGEVRKCKHSRSNIVRAVKILKKEKLDDMENERLHNEIEMLKVLDHPSILKIHEFYEDDKRFYFVMELCSGGELYDELNIRKQFEEPDAAVIIQ